MDTESLYKLYRTQLFSLAYRMLGSVMDAEDIVQEAFLKYGQASGQHEAIANKRAFLYKIVTNRCLDLLKSSAKKRETYVGPWLPEPLFDDRYESGDPSETYLQRESISTAYLLLLQQLNPVERAVFLLREIFGYSYDEISGMIGKTGANCRQICSRAKKSIEFDPADVPSVQVADVLLKEFASSLAMGNTKRLLELVSENVILYSDGGGKVTAARVPVAGLAKVLQFQQNLLTAYAGKFDFQFLSVNGGPGIRFLLEDGTQYIYSFGFKEGKIAGIYIVANPDKLRHAGAFAEKKQ